MATAGPRRTAQVTYDYKAEGDNQISIRKGETITVIGSPTEENWILAQKSDNTQGYIPNDYFKITSTSTGARPPPDTKADDAGITVSTTTSGNFSAPLTGKNQTSSGSSILGKDDTFNLFTYQFEWYTITLSFTAGVLALLYGTTEPNPYGAILWTSGILTMILTSVIALVLAQFREALDCVTSGNIGRALLFFILGLILVAGYPVSLGVAALSFMAMTFNLLVEWKYKCKPIPGPYQENWCNNIFGGMDTCTAGKLTAFFIWLAFDFLCFAWGFVDGYNKAVDITDSPNTSYYINKKTYGIALGFGRVVTINLFLLFLYACYGCLDRRTAALQASRRQDTICGKCHLYIAEKERRQYVHRLLAYPIVWGSILHIIANFFAYEDSGSTRSYRLAFGYETIITGNFLFVILGLIVASSNDKIREFNPELFRNSHLWALIFALLTIAHGTLGTNTTTAIAFVACGLGIYFIDWLMRCGGNK